MPSAFHARRIVSPPFFHFTTVVIFGGHGMEQKRVGDGTDEDSHQCPHGVSGCPQPRVLPMSRGQAVKVLPLPAGPYRVILSAAVRIRGFWKRVHFVVSSCRSAPTS